jgi:hypothetical protein
MRLEPLGIINTTTLYTRKMDLSEEAPHLENSLEMLHLLKKIKRMAKEKKAKSDTVI